MKNVRNNRPTTGKNESFQKKKKSFWLLEEVRENGREGNKAICALIFCSPPTTKIIQKREEKNNT
jgi:flagellar biosynthesis regulator FlaF